TAPFKSAQNVADRAFGNSELAADFGIGEAIAALGDVFEDVEGAFDGGCGVGVGCRHGGLSRPKSGPVPSIEYVFIILNSVLRGSSRLVARKRQREHVFSLLNNDTRWGNYASLVSNFLSFSIP